MCCPLCAPMEIPHCIRLPSLQFSIPFLTLVFSCVPRSVLCDSWFPLLSLLSSLRARSVCVWKSENRDGGKRRSSELFFLLLLLPVGNVCFPLLSMLFLGGGIIFAKIPFCLFILQPKR